MIEKKKDEYSFKTVNNPESGRSMVEMLGVLAVVGVLSIGGILGYTNAMNKSRANELLNEANKRATLYAIKQGSGDTTLSEFAAEASLGGGKMSNKILQGNGEFGIKISGVSNEVCQKLLEFVGDNTVLRDIVLLPSDDLTTSITVKDTPNECNGTIALVFNDDMGTEDPSAEPVCATCDGVTCSSPKTRCVCGTCECPEGNTGDDCTQCDANYLVVCCPGNSSNCPTDECNPSGGFFGDGSC